MRILGLHHAHISVPRAAEAEALDFYTRILGLTQIPKPESLLANGGFWCQLGDRQLHVGLEDGVDRDATKAHIGYAVDDLAAWRAHLEAAGLEIKQPTVIPNFERFECRDPFGNRIEILQEPQP